MIRASNKSGYAMFVPIMQAATATTSTAMMQSQGPIFLTKRQLFCLRFNYVVTQRGLARLSITASNFGKVNLWRWRGSSLVQRPALQRSWRVAVRPSAGRRRWRFLDSKFSGISLHALNFIPSIYKLQVTVQPQKTYKVKAVIWARYSIQVTQVFGGSKDFLVCSSQFPLMT